MKESPRNQGLEPVSQRLSRRWETVRRRAGASVLSTALALTAVGCAPSDPVPTAEPTPRVIDFERVTIPDLGISLETQKDLKIEDTPLSKENVREGIVSVLTFPQKSPELQLLVGQGKRIVKFKASLVPLIDIDHNIVITESSEVSSQLADYQTSVDAFTVMSDADSRTSFISPVGEGQGRYKVPVNRDQYNLSVELCNNFIAIVPVGGAKDALNLTFGEEQRDGALTWELIGNEVVCNSYALAVASKKEGVTYEDYAEAARAESLQDFASRGFYVPFVVFPQEIWSTL